MIDTIELMLDIDKIHRDELYDAINDAIEYSNETDARKSKKLHTDKKKRYVHTAAFHDYGILDLKLYSSMNYGLKNNWIVIRYKPAMRIYRDKYALAKEHDLIEASNIFEKFIGYLNGFVMDGFELPIDINVWKVRRIDYAFQFKTNYFREYLTLFKNGYKKLNDDVYDTSFYVKGKNTNVNFYDKTVQVLNKENRLHQLDFYTEHIVRLEVQCKRKYLDYIIYKNTVMQPIVKELWNMKVAAKSILSKLKSYIGVSDYWCLEKGLEILNNSFTEKKVAKIEKILHLTLHNRMLLKRVPEKIEEESKGLIKAKYVRDKLFPALKKVNMNPVCIPKYWGIEWLQNPVKLIPELKEYIKP